MLWWCNMRLGLTSFKLVTEEQLSIRVSIWYAVMVCHTTFLIWAPMAASTVARCSSLVTLESKPSPYVNVLFTERLYQAFANSSIRLLVLPKFTMSTISKWVAISLMQSTGRSVIFNCDARCPSSPSPSTSPSPSLPMHTVASDCWPFTTRFTVRKKTVTKIKDKQWTKKNEH